MGPKKKEKDKTAELEFRLKQLEEAARQKANQKELDKKAELIKSAQLIKQMVAPEKKPVPKKEESDDEYDISEASDTEEEEENQEARETAVPIRIGIGGAVLTPFLLG